jgi:FkbM family methyltransferase
MKIYYGIISNVIDVTEICMNRLLYNNNTIIIPSGDNIRSIFFNDHLVGVLKKIFIKMNDVITAYPDNLQIQIDITNNTIQLMNNNYNNINNKTAEIQSKLKINYGTFNDELPEQKMVVRYLTGNEKVLEIGGNIGRNTLVIASILNDSSNLVSLESDSVIAGQLNENKNLNNFNFHIENSALSNRTLIQRGWDTIPSDTLLDGYNWVNTITLDNLKNKYNIDFDTLVLDCEGAFYYILMDMPHILNNINLIIMENDYWDLNKKEYIDNVLIQNNFYRDYVEGGGWGPCYNNFFEVWKK